MCGIRVCALETICQQQVRPRGGLMLEAGAQVRRLLVGVRAEGGGALG